jgi:hypothetical protein
MILRIGLLCIASISVWAATRGPLTLDRDNPHYFSFHGKTVVLVTSGEHYGAVLNRDFDYKTYLAELRRNHLNLTRTFVGSYREISKPHDPAKGGYTIDENTLAPEADRFLTPWLPVKEAKQNGGIRFDLSRWNPAYFARLKDFLREADREGVVVELDLFCVMYDEDTWGVSPLNARNNVNGTEVVPHNDVFNLQHTKLQAVEDAMVRKIVGETRRFNNVYFEIINEPYWQPTKPEWQRHIASVITSAEQGQRFKHLISQNYANFSKKIEDADPNVSLFNFHYSRPPESVGLNYELNRPIGNNETGFDGGSDDTYRIQGWDFLAAGGALYNNLDYSFTVGRERGDYRYDPTYTPGGGSAELRKELGVLAGFFKALDLSHMTPAPGLLVGSRLEGGSARALVRPGRDYVIYVHQAHVDAHNKPAFTIDSTPHSATLRLELPRGPYEARWVDPKTGATVKKESFVHNGGEKELESPIYEKDIVLRIRASVLFR